VTAGDGIDLSRLPAVGDLTGKNSLTPDKPGTARAADPAARRRR
jgi:hypothetical protein